MHDASAHFQFGELDVVYGEGAFAEPDKMESAGLISFSVN
jgi:hypothetical protein